MSFLLRTLPRQTATLTSRRAFATSPLAQKSPVDTAKNAVKQADKTVSQAAVSGIEKGGMPPASSPVTSSHCFRGTPLRKKRPKSSYSSKIPSKHIANVRPILTEQLAQSMKSSASSATGQAKGKTSEMSGEAKGKASEVAGEAKGKAEEVKSKM